MSYPLEALINPPDELLGSFKNLSIFVVLVSPDSISILLKMLLFMYKPL